jgi:NAD(P)-dependent dehydrogenase (short-subunit alcohol dehydrogenase family)
MRELAGKAAFVTGGASGIGLALCRVFAKAGIKIMLADIEKEVLDTAMASLEGIGTEVRGVLCDVADPVSVDKAAEALATRDDGLLRAPGWRLRRRSPVAVAFHGSAASAG